MKFSEAILYGKRWPDVKNRYEDGCAVCAIGGAVRAMLECKTLPSDLMVTKQCGKLWPDLAQKYILCPFYGDVDSDGRAFDCGEDGYEELHEGYGTPFEVASHLFSDHNWSKDEVAAWVEKEIEVKK